MKEFTIDSNKLAQPLRKSTFTPCKVARQEWKEETDAFLNYSSDRAMTMPKGKSIEEKAYHVLNNVVSRPKGIKISEFPEGLLKNNGEEAIKLITQISMRPPKEKLIKSPIVLPKQEVKKGNGQKKDTKTKIQNSVGTEGVNLAFDRELAMLYAQTNNIKLDSSMSKGNKKDSNSKTVNNWRDYFLEEDLKNRKTMMDRYLKVFNKYKLNENLLTEKLTSFPMLGKDDVIKNRNLYNERERQLIDEFLFEELENSEKNIGKPIEKYILPTVSKVLEFSRSDQLNEALLKWKIDKVEKLGLQGFYEERRKNFSEGTELHQFIEQCLKSLGQENLEEVSTNKNISKLHFELERIIRLDFKNVQLIESEVIHKNLFYQGKMDCLAYYKGNLCLIDWKTSEKDKTELADLYDIPIQLSAYLGAFFNDANYDELRKNHAINYGLIVNINKTTDGNINFHLFNHQLAEFFWHKWLVSLKKFWIALLKEKNKSDENC